MKNSQNPSKSSNEVVGKISHNSTINSKEKNIKELEKEFNLMIQTQKDVLKTKSKIYQFVYSVIFVMRKEFIAKSSELEKKI